MKLLSWSLAVLATVSSAAAQSLNASLLDGIAATLENQGLTTFVDLLSKVNSSANGQYVASQLSDGGHYLLFAPTNQAFDNAPDSINDNLADIIAYHFVSGNFSGTRTTYPNITLGRTFLNNTNLVHLEGEKAQVVAWAVRSDGKTHVLNQADDCTVVNATTVGNLTVLFIDSVLLIPSDFETAVDSTNDVLTSLESTLQDVTVSYFNATTNDTSDMSAFDLVNSGFRGFTFFAPNNTALDAVQTSLAGLQSDETLIENVLFNHIINDSTVYSPELVGRNYVSAAGEPLTFHVNETGQYVTCGNVTALIVQPDILLSNGVVHVIDRAFLNTESDANAASSAAASATSSAAQRTTETLPIGYEQTASFVSSASASGASSISTHKNGAAPTLSGPGGLQLLSVSIAVMGVFAGSLFMAM